MTVTLSATCGESPWVQSIDKDLFSNLNDDLYQGKEVLDQWSQFKANVESSETTQRAIPDFCSGIVSESEPTCCNTLINLDYKKLIN